MKYDDWSALFIVKDGRLLDPFLQYSASKRGRDGVTSKEEKRLLDGLMREYVTGKTFDVYIGSDKAGELSALKLKVVNNCEVYRLLANIYGVGKYTDNPDYVNNADSLYTLHSSFEDEVTVKSIATPEGFSPSRKVAYFTVNESDRVRAIEAARKDLFGMAMEMIKNDLGHRHEGSVMEESVIVDEGEGWLASLRAYDINGDGMKDLIGAYAVRVRYIEVGRVDTSLDEYYMEIFFSVLGAGKAETIAYSKYNSSAFSLGGAIDIDQDGVLELVVLTPVIESDAEEGDYDEGRSIEVFRYGKCGWVKVYGTKGICAYLG